MKKLREAMLEEGVPAEQLSEKQVLSDAEIAALDGVSGAGEFETISPQFFGRIFGRIPF